MKELIAARLETLKKEYSAGQALLADLEAKQANLHTSLLRIGGAIQVLEELLDSGTAGEPPADSDARSGL
jgi:hypothetical protein